MGALPSFLAQGWLSRLLPAFDVSRLVLLTSSSRSPLTYGAFRSTKQHTSKLLELFNNTYTNANNANANANVNTNTILKGTNSVWICSNAHYKAIALHM